MVGPGRAGLGLAHAVVASGGAVVGVHGRQPRALGEPLGAATCGAFPDAVGAADVVFVAVQDRELEGALAELADALSRLAPRTRAVVLQASGSADADGFAPLRALGAACGTFHPLVPLAEPTQAPGLLRGAWIGLDGDAEAVRAGERLARHVGAHALRIPPGEKGRYHAAAVFASNFPIVLAAVAERLLAEAGVASAEARPAVRHLLSSAAANLARGDDAALALTGPVVRGDVPTVRKHVAALAADPGALAAYAVLAREALGVAERAGADRAALAEIAALLGASARA